jgi:hypothetical protein
MENQELHAQKVTILSRLIKENYLTLEEALLLLKDGEPIGTTSTAYVPPYGTWSSTGVPTFLSMTGANSIINTAVDNSADLNT